MALRTARESGAHCGPCAPRKCEPKELNPREVREAEDTYIRTAPTISGAAPLFRCIIKNVRHRMLLLQCSCRIAWRSKTRPIFPRLILDHEPCPFCGQPRIRQVNLAEHTLRLDTSKNGEPREAVMPSGLYALIRACVTGKRPEDHVFTRPDGKWHAQSASLPRKVAGGVGRGEITTCCASLLVSLSWGGYVPPPLRRPAAGEGWCEPAIVARAGLRRPW
jgi:hypothetical protein